MGDKRSEVWRRVDGQAVQCTECQMNEGHVLTGEIPVGIEYICTAPNHECIFLHKPLDNDKWYADFRDAYYDKEEQA